MGTASQTATSGVVEDAGRPWRRPPLPLFLVRRTNPYAKPTDLDAAMFRGLICSKEFPGLKWLRTYHTDGMTSAWCVYEANSIDDVAEYSNRASLDYDEIVEI